MPRTCEPPCEQGRYRQPPRSCQAAAVPAPGAPFLGAWLAPARARRSVSPPPSCWQQKPREADHAGPPTPRRKPCAQGRVRAKAMTHHPSHRPHDWPCPRGKCPLRQGAERCRGTRTAAGANERDQRCAGRQVSPPQRNRGDRTADDANLVRASVTPREHPTWRGNRQGGAPPALSQALAPFAAAELQIIRINMFASRRRSGLA